MELQPWCKNFWTTQFSSSESTGIGMVPALGQVEISDMKTKPIVTDILGSTWARFFSIFILHLFRKATKKYFQYYGRGNTCLIFIHSVAVRVYGWTSVDFVLKETNGRKLVSSHMKVHLYLPCREKIVEAEKCYLLFKYFFLPLMTAVTPNEIIQYSLETSKVLAWRYHVCGICNMFRRLSHKYWQLSRFLQPWEVPLT